MATWPSTNKALTTTTDADTDTISGARVDINKSISNINDVIDMFNIPASPTDDYILKYDAATSRFELEEDSGGGGLVFTNIQVDDLGAFMEDTLDYIDADYFDDVNIEADSSNDTLYLQSGTGISFTQDVTTDTITITNTGLTSESNDLTASVTWANVPDANITQSSVTQHQSALSITESQISDLGSYAENIGELGDVSITSVANNEALLYNSTSGNWENTSIFTNPATEDLDMANNNIVGIDNLLPDTSSGLKIRMTDSVDGSGNPTSNSLIFDNNSNTGTRILSSDSDFTLQATGTGSSLNLNAPYIEFSSVAVLASFTVATLPTVYPTGGLALCTNETGGVTVVFYDGTDWRRVQDRVVAS